jgi:small subunit ribosomal protein S16
MSVKIRLQRHGRKKQPYYHIVVADSRSPRDGKFIERIGSYNPNTNPATIDLDADKALSWVEKGAQPTDTARAILTYKGILYRKHLMRGVRKNAFTMEEADTRYAAWIENKATKIDEKLSKLAGDADAEMRTRMEIESKVAHKRAQDILAKKAALTAVPEEAADENAEGGEAATEEQTTNE